MVKWIEAGDKLLNTELIEAVELQTPSLMKIYMTSGNVITLTDMLATNVWNLLIADSVPFLNSKFPKRGFSTL